MLLHFATFLLLAALIALVWTDTQSFRLPDKITLPLIPAGLAVNIVLLDQIWSPLIGAALGYGMLVSVELGYRYLRGIDGLGRGDAKLLAAGGAWCGAWMLPVILLIGSWTALLYVFLVGLAERRAPDQTTAIAFGPWIAYGIFMAWFFHAFGAPFQLVF
ncbi:A24 family peptidase [Maricaulis sp.]|uniref:prepilin peptidase n=1 Tax=Maricaulis sp. TaxID=1486257 RepID=UPI00260F4E4C|nr:A24 family peptidase [Maricaulis sp.]